MRKSLLNTVAVASLLIAASPALAKGGTWVGPISLQNSESTTLFGINDKDVITGEYVDSSGVEHGFVGPFSGENYTSFDDAGGATEPRALNDKSDITGYDTGTLIEWERNSKGTLTNITMDGTDLTEIAQGINKAGVFAGNYDTSSGVSIGYLGKNAEYQKEIKLSLSNSGWAGRGIDDSGDIVGWFLDPSTQLQHGFIIIGKKATQIDYPDAYYTVMEGINNNGYATGQWESTSGVIQGFVYDIKKKKFTDLNVPDSTLTQVWGINNNNVIAASSSEGSYVYCMSKKGCPGTAAVFTKMPHVRVKYTPALP